MLKAIRFELNGADEEQLKKDIYKKEYSQKDMVKESIEKYIDMDATIDGSKLSEDWFPGIEADVFISHSHKNEDIAFGLKNKIESKTNHKCFVDSFVWGNSIDLLRTIDNKYCKFANGNTYDYNKRNYSTSHVYLMLNVALQKMIFKSQFVIFLDTPKSITVKDTISSSTNSPWIYSEISMVNWICEFQKLCKSIESVKQFSITENLKIKHNLDFSNFKRVSSLDKLLKILNEWK